MAKHTMHELQEGMGQTGRLGEIFLGLGIFIFLYGIALWIMTKTSAIATSPVGAVRASHDMFIVWFFYVVMGIGFSVFGIMAMLSGWGRHHPESSW